MIATEFKAEKRWHFDGQRRGNGQAQDNERLEARDPPGLTGGFGDHHQLFPQPPRVLTRELPRERVEAAHAFHRDEEGFVVRQTSLGEHRQLVAQVAFKLLHVQSMDGLPAAQVHPLLRDLLLKEFAIDGGRHAVRAFIQLPRRVSSTTRHCSRLAANCARPFLVMR